MIPRRARNLLWTAAVVLILVLWWTAFSMLGALAVLMLDGK